LSVEAGAVVAGFAASPAFGAAAFVAAGAFVTAGAVEFALAAGAGALVVATGLAGAFAFVVLVVGADPPQATAVTTSPASAKAPATFRRTFLVNVTFS
jgi:hypothetical protein